VQRMAQHGVAFDRKILPDVDGIALPACVGNETDGRNHLIVDNLIARPMPLLIRPDTRHLHAHGISLELLVFKSC
jgi:hypothetical protein